MFKLKTRRATISILATVMVAASMTIVGSVGVASAATTDVVISEIMYDPESDLDADEFLEIHNSGNTAVDLSGWCVDGISFCFDAGSSIDAGEYLVLSPDAARTLAFYGVSTAGVYAGGLKNGGEELQLLDSNGALIHSVDYDDAHPWPVLPDGQGPSLELISLDADRSSPWNWAASNAGDGNTAGQANSVAAAGTPPEFGVVEHSNSSPAGGEAIVVTAEVVGSTATPVLFWRVNMGSMQPITMGGLGANMWTATIPAQGEGDLVEYRIQATGAFDHSFPRVDDSSTTVGIFYPRSVSTNLPVFEWFINDSDYQSMITDHLEDDKLFPMALVVGDEVITDARVRVRGSSSVFDPKVNFKFEMPRGYDLILDGLLVEPVDEFAIQAEYSDRAYGRSLLSWRAYEIAELPVPQVFKVRVERNGSFQGLYNYMDTYDKTWRKREGFQNDGALYKAKTGAFSTERSIDKRWDQKSGVDDGLASLGEMIDFIQDPNPAVREAYVREHVDVPAVINYAAATAILEHIDSSSKNFYAYQSYATSRWSIIPWDLDHTLGNGCSCNVFSDFVTPAEPGDKVNEMVAAVLEVDEFEEMYFRRVRSLVDELLAPGLLEGIFDAEVGPAAPEAALDKTVWGQCCTVSFDRSQLFDDIAARRDLFNSDPRVEASQTNNPEVVITEIMADPTNGDAEYIEIYNPTADSIDLSGWSISDAIDLEIAVGTVILPQSPMVFVADDVTFGLTYGRTLFVGGAFAGGLAAGGEGVTLMRADGSTADTIVYGDPGWPAIGQDESIELISAGLDNNNGASWLLVPGGTPGLFAGNGGVPIAPNAPLVPFDPLDPPVPYRCMGALSADDAVLTFTGDGGDNAQLRYAGGGWVANVTGLGGHTVQGGAGDQFEVRVRGTGFETPYSTIPCDFGGPVDPPDPDEYTCTVAVAGGDAVLNLAGERGSSENLRIVGGGWVATVTGLGSYTVVGGAGDQFEVRARGAGFENPYSVVPCN